MKCPYCGKEMVDGKIYGDRYQMKWMPNDQNLMLGIWVHGDYIPLGSGALSFERPNFEASYCQSCEKMIINVRTQRSE